MDPLSHEAMWDATWKKQYQQRGEANLNFITFLII